jgi:hypothetical protein
MLCLVFLLFLKENPQPALWELWESRSVFCGGFSKHLVEIIK